MTLTLHVNKHFRWVGVILNTCHKNSLDFMQGITNKLGLYKLNPVGRSRWGDLLRLYL